MRRKVQQPVELPTVTACPIALLAHTYNKTAKGHGSASRMSETQASRGTLSPALATTDLSSRQLAEGRVAVLEG
jgi:hypothetical protein